MVFQVANVDGGTGGGRHITMPDGVRRDHFLHWVETLSDRQTPSWLGLPNNAEKVLLTTRGKLLTPFVLNPWLIKNIYISSTQ
jgi:hypothetical protein